MPNMDYCRFENTYNDLLDCQNHLEDNDLSDSEEIAKENLLSLCEQITEWVNHTNFEEEDE